MEVLKIGSDLVGVRIANEKFKHTYLSEGPAQQAALKLEALTVRTNTIDDSPTSKILN